MNKQSGRIGLYLVLIVMLVAGYFYLNNQVASQSSYSMESMKQAAEDGKLSSAKIYQNREVPTGSVVADIEGEGKKKVYVTDVKDAQKLLEGYGIHPEVADVPQESVFMTTFFPVLLTGGLVIFLFLMMNRQMSGGGGNAKMMNFGKSRARMMLPDDKKVTFQNVAGLQEEKEDLVEVVDFLKAPQKYTNVGARIPKGVILVGPPGTGKTLLAKAVAGEAKVPFFSLSGSAFVEMYVGVGASRVRDLFKQAQQMAPCIIFIDEIDAIGKSRDSRYGGGNDEREQTLNQLLAEMDGFDSSKGVLILAATNRPEVLDSALLRPGRFDRRVIVDRPDLKGREDILRVHAKNVNLDETVNFKEIALATAGAVGSDLANMVNEAAILAVKAGRSAVSQADLSEAVELVEMGKEKKNKILSKKEREIVSYHEVGHALVNALQKDAEPVQKITIVPRTMGALGYVMQVPEEEKYLNTKKELEAMLVGYLGGRAAEEIVFDTVTTGAANDIEQATKVARAMITQYGMSEKFGLMGLATQENQYLSGRAVLNCGDDTATEIDHEVMKLLHHSYEEAKRILGSHRTEMDKIAEYLIRKETITGKEFMKILRAVQQGLDIPENLDDLVLSEDEKEVSNKQDIEMIAENNEAAKSTESVQFRPEISGQELTEDMQAPEKTEESAQTTDSDHAETEEKPGSQA